MVTGAVCSTSRPAQALRHSDLMKMLRVSALVTHSQLLSGISPKLPKHTDIYVRIPVSPGTYLSAHYVTIGSLGLKLFTYGSVQTPFSLVSPRFLNIIAISSHLLDISSQIATHDLNLLSPLAAITHSFFSPHH